MIGRIQELRAKAKRAMAQKNVRRARELELEIDRLNHMMTANKLQERKGDRVFEGVHTRVSGGTEL